MPAFTQDPNNHESLRLREVDVLVLACIFAAAIMSLVGLFHSGKPAAPANGIQTAVYYPVGYVAPIAAPVASADITNGPPPGPADTLSRTIPQSVLDAAVAASAAKPLNPRGRKGTSFITLLGETWADGHFFRSKTNRAEGHYGGRWAPENVVGTSEGARFIVEKETDGGAPFSIAEARTSSLYGYGRYEAVMQPGRGSGLVTALFTYTGPYAGDPHDEIDIEFLGKDLTKIHFNYWRNGSRGNYATFDLPFDAGDAPHLYGFEWRPDKITWFVDGEVFHETVLDDRRIPTTPGRLYISHWTGPPGMRSWHGAPTFKSGVATKVSCVSFTPLGETGRSCSDLSLIN